MKPNGIKISAEDREIRIGVTRSVQIVTLDELMLGLALLHRISL